MSNAANMPITSELMPLERFMDIPRYEPNRPEERRQKKEHLNGELASAAMRVVAAIQGSNGSRRKIDGHSRVHNWSNGRLRAPETVLVVIYHTDNEEEVYKIYKSYTASETAATPFENAYTARIIANFEPQSKMMKKGMNSAFKRLGYKDVKAGTVDCLEQLRLMDSWGINEGGVKYSNGAVAAMIKTLRNDPEIAPIFWEMYNSGTGSQSILDLMEYLQDNGDRLGSGFAGELYNEILNRFRDFKRELAGN